MCASHDLCVSLFTKPPPRLDGPPRPLPYLSPYRSPYCMPVALRDRPHSVLSRPLSTAPRSRVPHILNPPPPLVLSGHAASLTPY
jgi:hypothetical protein